MTFSQTFADEDVDQVTNTITINHNLDEEFLHVSTWVQCPGDPTVILMETSGVVRVDNNTLTMAWPGMNCFDSLTVKVSS